MTPSGASTRSLPTATQSDQVWPTDMTSRRTVLLGLGFAAVGYGVARHLRPSMGHQLPGGVVMGSAGRTGLSHFLLGSKAEQILRLSPVPVTIVKAPHED